MASSFIQDWHDLSNEMINWKKVQIFWIFCQTTLYQIATHRCRKTTLFNIFLTRSLNKSGNQVSTNPSIQ